MPYSAEHKRQARKKIVEAARILFNRHGFENVTIDQIMDSAGLTRGGFYSHFENKQALYGEAVASFLMGRGAQWRDNAGVNIQSPSPEMVQNMIKSYLSDEHLGDLDGQCPMIALSSDAARADDDVRTAYQGLLESMIWLFEQCFGTDEPDRRQRALTLSALCVGGMTLARTLPDKSLAKELREAALQEAGRIQSGAAAPSG
ncbi:TetR/AcrR family transcriptional regulator [Sphingopyxis sp. BSNA05]|uniref:TetR/AcrR family transcriptional regulator n=1 Tax=Sphingopyxis sp. BSNA05 TaxID=1236614 RepID=UPI0015664FD3|nr:TetR/AcrR family transcriptional regulator [Sphingopyxis sp. BSNA05]NRD88377.1 TetR/AcrR family transcriptional regulator [Sphingopyxis sp. BSNA05]